MATGLPNTRADRPVVSVVLPVYNAEERLERCLDSLARQTLRSLEILIVNDGSTDDSQRIVDACVRADPASFRSIFLPRNRGLGPARNTGLRSATGSYIGFVDADDWVAEPMFEMMARKAADSGADIVVCDAEIIDSEGRHAAGMVRRHQEDPLFMTSPAAWNKIFRARLFRDHDIRFPASFAEDLATIPKLMLNAARVQFVEESLYRYDRTNPQSLTATITDRPDRVFDYLSVLGDLIGYFESHHGSSRYLDSFRRGLIHQANAGCCSLRRHPRLLGEFAEGVKRLLEPAFPGILTPETFPWAFFESWGETVPAPSS